MRSEYASVENISITKTYTDKNGWYLKSGDKIAVKVEIKNNKNSQVKNIAYLDNAPEPFVLGEETKYKFKLGNDYKSITPKSAPDWAPFNFIYHFDLQAAQTATFEYELDTLAFSYWELQAWLFETGELWDDLFWDILLKKNAENCWESNTIYRSFYYLWKRRKEATCDPNKSALLVK